MDSTCPFPKRFPSKPKPCNCTKSHCLKLYCECFAQGIQCDDCNCANCMNNNLHEEDRTNAIKLTLERNPLAFHSKFGNGEYKRLKGCTCKRSQCLKNYCECYEAKINCSGLCRCQGCRNVDNERQQYLQAEPFHSTTQKLLLNKRSSNIDFQDQMKYKRRVDPSVLNLPCEEFYEDSVSLKFLSSGFVEAACNLILTQLIEAKLKNFSLVDQEKVITEEFGRCLLQIMNLLSHTPFSEYNYNPAYTTILPFAQRNISLQSANQDQGPYEQSLNCDSRKDQTNQYLFAEYGLKNAEYCKNAIFDNHNEFDSTKHENSLPTIEKWYNFEKYEDSQILNNHQTHNSNKFVTRDLEHCDILSVLDHQPGLSEIHNRDKNQNYSEVEYPVVHQPESYVSSTDNYFFSDTNSLSVSNNKPHSQTLNMGHTLHSNIQYKNRCSPSAVYELDFIPELEFYNL
ncbi:Protein lin-54 like [Schistosoma japonicum]|nr:Protein lin-54 like [Schistosoma japonicum]